MLERFKVKEEEAVRVPAESLRQTVAAIFEKMNVSSQDAQVAAEKVMERTGVAKENFPWRWSI